MEELNRILEVTTTEMKKE